MIPPLAAMGSISDDGLSLDVKLTTGGQDDAIQDIPML